MDTESLCNEIRKDMEGVGKDLLPMDGFPQKFQKLLLDLSYYDGYNLEITAMCLLSALSAAIGNSLWLHIKGNWCTNAALYVLLVGRPGLGKTHPMRFAYGPIYAQDRIRFDQYKTLLFFLFFGSLACYSLLPSPGCQNGSRGIRLPRAYKRSWASPIGVTSY